MIPVIGIPYLNRPDLLERCLRSIDRKVDTVVIVNNSDSLITSDYDLSKRICVDSMKCQSNSFYIAEMPLNAGVAASWNEVIKLFPAPWWLIVNSDIEFAPGDLAKFEQAIQTTEAGIVADGINNMACFGITANCVQRVGLFDENFFPAYGEDIDYMRRCRLLGVEHRYLQGTGMRHDRSSTVKALPAELQDRNRETFEANKAYYERKWGGWEGQETFEHPFNDPGWPVWAWKFDCRMRKEQQW